MILPIYVYGAPVLREIAAEVELESEGAKEEIVQLIADMWETMEAADGVGLAAPQVGHSKRILIVDGSLLEESYPELATFKRTMINPKVVSESDTLVSYDEGCLSVPDIWAPVERVDSIEISYLNEKLEEVTEKLEGFACRMVQHEMDHLNGILFTDRVAPIRKKMVRAKLSSIAAGKFEKRYKVAK